MPIYEYECKKCHKMTEVMQKISDPGPAKCPHCGSKRIERVMSQTSFQLKGEGWYITDYSRKDKEKKAAKKSDDSGGGSTSESKSESKTETKSESKSESKSKSESESESKSDKSKKSSA